MKDIFMKKIKESNDNQLIFGNTNTHYFTKNWIQKEMLSQTCMVIFDFDAEYKKMCEHLGGNYIEISKENHTNPFLFEGQSKTFFILHLLAVRDWLQIALQKEFNEEEEKFVLDQLEQLYEPSYSEGENAVDVKINRPYATLQTFITLLEKNDEIGKDMAIALKPFIPYFKLEKPNFSVSKICNVFSFSDIEEKMVSLYMFSTLMFVRNMRKEFLDQSIHTSIVYENMEEFAKDERLYEFSIELATRYLTYGSKHLIRISDFEKFSHRQLDLLVGWFDHAMFFPKNKNEIEIMQKIWGLKDAISQEQLEKGMLYLLYCDGAWMKKVHRKELEKDFFE